MVLVAPLLRKAKYRMIRYLAFLILITTQTFLRTSSKTPTLQVLLLLHYFNKNYKRKPIHKITKTVIKQHLNYLNNKISTHTSTFFTEKYCK